MLKSESCLSFEMQLFNYSRWPTRLALEVVAELCDNGAEEAGRVVPT